VRGVNRFDSCAAVVPCWNEAATIGPLVARARSCLPQVIVVDDGSTDRTATVARAAGAAVVRHPRNLGKGAALRTGLTRAAALGFAWAVTFDGDGQHCPADIPAFLERAAATGAALVVGNRMAGAAQMPWPRRVVNRWMSRQLSRRAGVRLPDSQCGFRLLNLAAWQQLRLECDHFEVESETILAFVAAGWRVEFVPIPVIPSSRPSRIRVVADTLRWLRWWLACMSLRRPRIPTGCGRRRKEANSAPARLQWPPYVAPCNNGEKSGLEAGRPSRALAPGSVPNTV
jgi:glycosyltransferase involved in cell wall biosynthesis